MGRRPTSRTLKTEGRGEGSHRFKWCINSSISPGEGGLLAHQPQDNGVYRCIPSASRRSRGRRGSTGRSYTVFFFRKDRPHSEGNRHAHLGIKAPPARIKPQCQPSNIAHRFAHWAKPTVNEHRITWSIPARHSSPSSAPSRGAGRGRRLRAAARGVVCRTPGAVSDAAVAMACPAPSRNLELSALSGDDGRRGEEDR